LSPFRVDDSLYDEKGSLCKDARLYSVERSRLVCQARESACRKAWSGSGCAGESGKGDRTLYVGSYEHEWDDDELNQAFASCDVVTLGFLKRLMNDGGISPLQSMLPSNHGHAGDLLWWPRKERCEGEERAFPQTFGEWLAMDRRTFGTDGTEIGIVSMISGKQKAPAMNRILTWLEAFFYPARVSIQGDQKPNSKGKSKKKKSNVKKLSKEAVSFDALLGQIEIPEECMAVVGITDLNIYEGEEREDEVIMYGRATGDGAGIMSLFHFKSTGRVFLSTVAHELLHVFGMDHCDDFLCVMNPHCDHEDEESSYILLCPPCLAKLQHSLKFDVRERYEKLILAVKELGFDADAALVQSILDKNK
jgi:predicted Zn-dependent protease